MRLSLNLGYFGSGMDDDIVPLAVQADQLGYDCVFVAEAYGSDAATVLAWIGARTERIGLGSAVFQIPARSAAMTAMTAATLDLLSGGRFRLGLGVSGPQVSEGWHGVAFADPLGRTREYVDVVRQALRREPVDYAGQHIQLPLPDGAGKALRLGFRTRRPDVPIYLAAVGPKNLSLAGQIADGWHGVFFSPEHSTDQLAIIAAARVAAGKADESDPLANFDTVVTVPVCLADDLDVAAAAIAPYCALYLGGMGSLRANFYARLATSMGFGEETERIQNLYLDGKPREAAAAVPRDFIDATALIGPPARVSSRLQRYATAGITTLAISPVAPDSAARATTVATMATVARQSPDSTEASPTAAPTPPAD